MAVTRAEIEAALAYYHWAAPEAYALRTMIRLAEAVLEALDSPASHEAIEAAALDEWDDFGDGYQAFCDGHCAGERHALARLVKEEVAGGGTSGKLQQTDAASDA